MCHLCKNSLIKCSDRGSVVFKILLRYDLLKAFHKNRRENYRIVFSDLLK